MGIEIESEKKLIEAQQYLSVKNPFGSKLMRSQNLSHVILMQESIYNVYSKHVASSSRG